jgi:cytochrome c
MTDLPTPADLPLPLPVPAELLAVLLVLFFVLHILFVNLMLGGSLLAVLFEVVGLRRPQFDTLAHHIARTVTVTKSLAVVLGVGPLLAINLLYTVPFYSANRAIGRVWLLIIPLTIAAFCLSYLHKYTWERLLRYKTIHLTIGTLAAVVYLSIPLIFLVNVNLMQFPERWETVQRDGFISGLLLDNVLPRYIHFVLAALAGTALFLVWYFTRTGFALEQELPGETRATLRARFYTIALVTSLIQFVAGPMVLFTLPPHGIGWLMLAATLSGAVLAGVVVWWMWREITRADAGDSGQLDWRFWRIIVAMTVVVVLMATGRQLYRANALRPFEAQMAVTTLDRQALSAHYRAHPAPATEEDPLASLPGYSAFSQRCGACHALDEKLAGPPLREIAGLYPRDDDINALINWVRSAQNPRKVRSRSDYPSAMPAMGSAQVDDAALRQIASFIQEAAKR